VEGCDWRHNIVAARQTEEITLNLISILFELRVGINHKEYPEYDIVHGLIIF
jgi:hypothetical protein